MKAISRQSDCDNPTIWPNVQRTATSISVQNPHHQHQTNISKDIQQISYSKIQLVNWKKNSAHSFSHRLLIPISCKIYRKEQLQKVLTIVADLFWLNFRRVVTQWYRPTHSHYMHYKGSPLLLAHQQSLGKLLITARHRQDTVEHVLH